MDSLLSFPWNKTNKQTSSTSPPHLCSSCNLLLASSLLPREPFMLQETPWLPWQQDTKKWLHKLVTLNVLVSYFEKIFTAISFSTFYFPPQYSAESWVKHQSFHLLFTAYQCKAGQATLQAHLLHQLPHTVMLGLCVLCRSNLLLKHVTEMMSSCLAVQVLYIHLHQTLTLSAQYFKVSLKGLAAGALFSSWYDKKIADT